MVIRVILSLESAKGPGAQHQTIIARLTTAFKTKEMW